MKSPPSTHITLTRAQQCDIPSLVSIHMAAFAFDNCARLMFKDSDTYEKKVQEMLGSQISDPNFAVVKAVGEDGNEILGWLACSWVGYDEKETPAKVQESKKKDDTFGWSLRSAISKDFARVQSEWLARRKYIHVGTVVSDPAHQCQGVGTALVHWATTRADDDGIPCWVQSSPVAHTLYYRAGFRDVGRLEIDLRDFVPGAQQRKLGWGPFQFRYMLRLPEPKGEGEI